MGAVAGYSRAPSDDTRPTFYRRDVDDDVALHAMHWCCSMRCIDVDDVACDAWCSTFVSIKKRTILRSLKDLFRSSSKMIHCSGVVPSSMLTYSLPLSWWHRKVFRSPIDTRSLPPLSLGPNRNDVDHDLNDRDAYVTCDCICVSGHCYRNVLNNAIPCSIPSSIPLPF